MKGGSYSRRREFLDSVCVVAYFKPQAPRRKAGPFPNPAEKAIKL